MHYVKHPEHGNRHVTDEELPALIADGWVKWPRTKAQKQAADSAAVPIKLADPIEPPAAPVAPARRAPGRPRRE